MNKSAVKSRPHWLFGVSIIAWLLWMLIVYLYFRSVDYSYLVYFSFFYAVMIPIGIIKFIEKQSVSTRLGLQTPLRYIGLMVLGFVSLSITYFSNLVSWAAFFSLVIAPFSEEIFFRGYMLGRCRSEKSLFSTWIFPSTFLVSVLFSVSHALNPDMHLVDLVEIFLFGVLFGFAYWLTGSIIIPIVLHLLYNFTIEAGAHLYSVGFWLCVLVIIAPVLLLITEYLLKRKRQSIKMNYPS